jgi:hypothetical protein
MSTWISEDRYWFDGHKRTDQFFDERRPEPLDVEVFKKYYDGTDFSRGDGNYFWFNDDGLFHNDKDRPVIILKDGTQVWMENGLFHREDDKPAIVRGCGIQEWYYKGDRHRHEDKELKWVIKYNHQGYPFKLIDTSHWVKKDYEYKPAILYPDGYGICYYFDRIHNLNGPAVVAVKNGKKYYKYYSLGTSIRLNGFQSVRDDWDYHMNAKRRINLPTV